VSPCFLYSFSFCRHVERDAIVNLLCLWPFHFPSVVLFFVSLSPPFPSHLQCLK
jgi:hypothetical protein